MSLPKGYSKIGLKVVQETAIPFLPPRETSLVKSFYRCHEFSQISTISIARNKMNRITSRSKMFSEIMRFKFYADLEVPFNGSVDSAIRLTLLATNHFNISVTTVLV